MVCYEPPNISSVPLEKAVSSLSLVDPTGSAVQAARAMAVSFGDQPGFSNPFPQSKVNAKTLVEQFDIPLASLNELME